jgi:hypothetical protein
MPVKSEPKERPLILMLLSACDTGAWQQALLDWVEEKADRAVEVIATRPDGTQLALEHTLIQPFVGEKFDSEVFIRAFVRIEKNPALTLPERNLDVIIPVHAIPKGYDWDEVGKDLLDWLLENHPAAPQEGLSSHVVTVAATSKNGPLALPITLRTMHLHHLRIAVHEPDRDCRCPSQQDLGIVPEVAQYATAEDFTDINMSVLRRERFTEGPFL